MFDEVFGAQCLVSHIIWQHSIQGKGYTDKFSVHHNHLLAYGKADFGFDGLDRTDENNLNYSNPDDDPRGAWRSGDVRNSLHRENLKYKLPTPSGTYIDPPEKGWRWQPSTMQAKIATKEVQFVDNDTRIIRKIFLEDQEKRAPETIWFASEVGSTRDANKTLKQIFGENPFPTPKPVPLVARVLSLATSNQSIILDSFAGSGTTAHAVLRANEIDGGNRRFILVEGENYADTLTAERVRRVINGYEFQGEQSEELFRESITFTSLKKANKILDSVAAVENLQGQRFDKIFKKIDDGELIVTGEKKVTERAEGLGGSFTYCTLGPPVELDTVLSGKELPPYTALGAALFHMATNQAFESTKMVEAESYLGETETHHVWLIYRPDLEWLKTPDAALTLSRAQNFARAKQGKRHLVFAPSRFVSQKMLNEHNVPVEFVPLPFALYRIERP